MKRFMHCKLNVDKDSRSAEGADPVIFWIWREFAVIAMRCSRRKPRRIGVPPVAAL